MCSVQRQKFFFATGHSVEGTSACSGVDSKMVRALSVSASMALPRLRYRMSEIRKMTRETSIAVAPALRAARELLRISTMNSNGCCWSVSSQRCEMLVMIFRTALMLRNGERMAEMSDRQTVQPQNRLDFFQFLYEFSRIVCNFPEF